MFLIVSEPWNISWRITKHYIFDQDVNFNCLSMELIRLGGPGHGIVTKTVHKTLPGGGWVGGWCWSRGGWVSRGGGVQGVGGCVGRGQWGFRGGGVQGWWGSRGGWVGGGGVQGVGV